MQGAPYAMRAGMRGRIVPCADFIQSLDTDSLHLPETLMHVTSWAKWCRSRHARCRSEYSWPPSTGW